MNCSGQINAYSHGMSNYPSSFVPTQYFPENMGQIPFSYSIPSLSTGIATGPSQGPAPIPQEVSKLPSNSAYSAQAPASPIPGAMQQFPQLITGPAVGEQPPTTYTSVLYIPGFMKTQIGRKVRVEFLIGSNGLVDRFGTLVGVGSSYILIREAETDDLLLCDIYSIKFVRFYY